MGFRTVRFIEASRDQRRPMKEVAQEILGG
jgi:hypothetical protein